MKRKLNFLQKASIYFIKNMYQVKISSRLLKKGVHCRFYPSCSNYGIMAIKKYGFFVGWMKTIYRIWRCNKRNNKSCVDYP